MDAIKYKIELIRKLNERWWVFLVGDFGYLEAERLRARGINPCERACPNKSIKCCNYWENLFSLKCYFTSKISENVHNVSTIFRFNKEYIYAEKQRPDLQAYLIFICTRCANQLRISIIPFETVSALWFQGSI